MKTTLIRLLLIITFYLIFRFVFVVPEELLTAFVVTYILEPFIIQKT